MANEFKHKTVGTVLTQAEWEATDGTSHQLDSQATGDIIYASSSTVLSRLGVGTDGDLLNLGSGIPAWTSAISTAKTFADNILLGLGTGADGVLLNRSTTLAANTALTGVMIGTPVTPAVAANSLLVSNVTASGDYLLALNNGGNSQAWHWVDSSGGTQTLYAAGVARILLNSTGGSFTGTWSDLGTVTTVDINGGSVDGAAIGAASHSTIKGTTIDATTDFTIGSTVITDDTITFGAAASVLTTAGNLTLQAAAAADVLIGDDVTLFVVDGGAGTVGFGASAPAATRAQAWTRFPALAFTGDGSNTFSRFEFSWDAAVTVSSGDLATLANVKIVRAGGAVSGVNIDVETSLWLSDPPSGDATLKYALWVDSGISKFDGAIIGTTIDATTDFTIGTTVITDDDITFGAAGNIETSAGDLTLNPAASLNVTLTAADADAFTLNNGTDDYYNLDTRIVTREIFAHTFDQTNVEFAVHTDGIVGLMLLNGADVNYTDTGTVAALQSQMRFNPMRITADGASATWTQATTIRMQAPTEGTNGIITNASAIRIQNASGTPVNQYGLYIEALTAGATKDYSIYTNAGDVRFGGSVSIDGDIDFEGPQEITTSSGALTLIPASDFIVTLNDDESGALAFNNSAVGYYIIDTRNASSGIVVHSFDSEDIALASSENSQYKILKVKPITTTYTGGTRQTNESTTVDFDAMTFVGGSAITVDAATTLKLKAPIESTNVTMSVSSALHIVTTTGTPTRHHGILIDTLSGGVVSNSAITVGNTDADQEIIHVGVTGHPTFLWDESEDAFAFTKGVQVDESARTLASGANAYAVRLKTTNAITTFGSGTNALVATLRVDPPNITDGGATLSDTACLYIDNDATEGQGNYSIWVNAGNTRLDGDVDLNGTGDLLNVGAAGNDWTTNEIKLSASYAGGTQNITATNTENGNAASHARMVLSTGGASGGDPFIMFDIAATQTVTMGLDNTTSDNFTISDNSTLGTNDRLRLVTTSGVLSVDGDGGGSDDPVSLFDDYDDVAELRRYQLAIPGSPITIAERDENRQRLVEMGVGEWAVQESGPDRWMMRVQPLTRLLAGGIYQNRERMVSIEERLAALEAQGG